MRRLRQSNGKVLLLITAILILCSGFFIVSCGSKSESARKTNNPNEPTAVDFTRCPGERCHVLADGSVDFTPLPSIGGREITMEAWVKGKNATVSGGVFSRLDTSGGALLYVKNNEPKFAIRVLTASTSSPGVTSSVDYVVGSGFALVQDAWNHIAGVIANAAHSHTASASCTATVMAEEPHLDIYVNGEFENCATTWGKAGDPATGPQFADNSGGQQLLLAGIQFGPVDGVQNTNLEAVVDELRLWTSGRTASQISNCKDTELGVGGECDRSDKSLMAYYRFNEGEGGDATDFSGNGFSGSFTFYNPETPWEDNNKWVTGAPIKAAD